MCCWQEMMENATTGWKEDQWYSYSFGWSFCSVSSTKYMGWYDASGYQWILPTEEKGENEVEGDNINNEDSTEINTMKEMDHRKVITGWWTNAWHGSQRYRGWSLEGLNQFNKLVAMVQQDREMDEHFQAQYKIWLKESVANKTKKKQRKNNKPVVRAYQDLSSLGV